MAQNFSSLGEIIIHLNFFLYIFKITHLYAPPPPIVLKCRNRRSCDAKRNEVWYPPQSDFWVPPLLKWRLVDRWRY